MNLSQEPVKIKGRIFDFHRYAIHDGPGIRSVLFLSGCPLRCRWCCNPESYLEDPKVHREISVEDVLQLLRQDLPYFRNSGGGLTLSGGEPLLQADFIKTLFLECRSEGIGTAVETCGEVPWDSFAVISGLVDFYLFDIKQTDANLHLDGTRISNLRIMDNLRHLSLTGARICLRVPLIPEFNMTDEFAFAIAELAKEINAYQVHLLPYHMLGSQKYLRLGVSYQNFKKGNIKPKSGRGISIAHFSEIINTCNKDIFVGG